MATENNKTQVKEELHEAINPIIKENTQKSVHFEEDFSSGESEIVPDSIPYTFKNVIHQYSIELSLQIPSESSKEFEALYRPIEQIGLEGQLITSEILKMNNNLKKRVDYLDTIDVNKINEELNKLKQNKDEKAQIKNAQRLNKNVAKGKIFYETMTIGELEYESEKIASKIKQLSSEYEEMKKNIDPTLKKHMIPVFDSLDKLLTENKVLENKLSNALKENINREPNCGRELFNEKALIRVIFPPTLEKEYISLIDNGLLEINKEKQKVMKQINQLHEKLQNKVLRNFKNHESFEVSLKERMTELKNSISKNTNKLVNYKQAKLKRFHEILGVTKKLKGEIARDQQQLALISSPKEINNLLQQAKNLKDKFNKLNLASEKLQDQMTPELAKHVMPFLEHNHKLSKEAMDTLMKLNPLKGLSLAIDTIELQSKKEQSAPEQTQHNKLAKLDTLLNNKITKENNYEKSADTSRAVESKNLYKKDINIGKDYNKYGNNLSQIELKLAKEKIHNARKPAKNSKKVDMNHTTSRKVKNKEDLEK
ncbi:hypothetical protein ACTNBL_01745 [Enterococcus villorum]|uniref:hypothetical protein n=1 Tax=Enterococcus villorum TaxID=112904 RepID=UPI003F8B1346